MTNWLFLILCSCLFSNTKTEDAKKPPSIEGKWQIQLMLLSGMEPPDRKTLYKSSMTFNGKEMIQECSDGKRAEGKVTYKLNQSMKPPWIDLTFKSGAQSHSMKGIYEFKENKLKIAWSDPGKPRPKSFRSEKGSHVNLEILMRSGK